MPSASRLAAGTATVVSLVAAKYFMGSSTANMAERSMHGRVVLMTGGTSGIGAVVARELARRGAHLVLLTAQPPSDPFVADYVEELRMHAGHQLVYAEQADLTSLHSIRTFATKWIDSLPVRRLDMVILCAAVAAETAERSDRDSATHGKTTADGLERAWMVNYLANFHLLGLLSPALRSQPFDRDVRVILTTCASYIGAPTLTTTATATDVGARDQSITPPWTPRRAYARSKLALMVFARAFQKHVDAYKRPDGLPGNIRVLLVDPGMARTPGLRHWVAGSSLWLLLLLYVLFYPFWWLFVPSAEDGAQSVLFAALEGGLRRMQDMGTPGTRLHDEFGQGTDLVALKLVKACRLVDVARRDVADEAVAKALWEDSDALVEATEKWAAQRRQQAREAADAAAQADAEAQQASEIESLVSTIRQGKAREAAGVNKGAKDEKKSGRRKA